MVTFDTIENWFKAIKGHHCDKYDEIGDRRKFDAADDPLHKDGDKLQPLIGYKCKACGETFYISGFSVFHSPDYDGNFKTLFSDVNGRMRLAALLSRPPPTPPPPSMEEIDAAAKRLVSQMGIPDGQEGPRLELVPKAEENPPEKVASKTESLPTKERRWLAWEKLDDDGFEWRASVPGGWLVRTMDKVVHFGDGMRREGNDWRPALCFLPDPGHEWRKQ
jgi:hypothetical protein